MKKNNSALLVLFVLGLMTVVMSKESYARAQDANGNPNTQVVTTAASPAGTQVKNQNQVSTQNMGEESNLMVSTSEQEGTVSGMGLENKKAIAVERMSMVGAKVQELLQIKTTGGIGDQVRTLAQDQIKAQDQIQLQLDKVDSKGTFTKALFGPDYKALKSLEGQMEQNQLRIQALQELQTQITNSGDETTLEATIQSLIDQNTALQDAINLEGQTKSLFGWLVRLFVK